MEKELKNYVRLVENYAWYSEGNIFDIAKIAKKLGRDYMRDIVDFKVSCVLADSLKDRSV